MMPERKLLGPVVEARRRSVVGAVAPKAEAKGPLFGQGPDFLEVLSRSLKVIETMGGQREPFTISDLARATGLPKPSVRRVLHTLCALGYAGNEGRGFRLTPKIVRFATAFLSGEGHAQVLQPACEELSQQTGQSCLVGVLDDNDVLVVAYTMPQQLMSRSLGVGTRFPAYCTAAGRILMGQKSDAELDAYLSELRPVAQTEATCISKARIKAEILATRGRGYSVMEDEFVMGWRTVAFPLLRHDGSTFGTLNLNCKKSAALTDEKFARFTNLCRRKAEALKSLLV